MVISIFSWHISLQKETGRIGKQRKNQDHPVHSIVKISRNTEESPRDLTRLSDAQTPMKDH